MTLVNKVIIVEGKSDKKRVQQVIAEPVHIICTHGTMSIDKIDDMIESLYGKQVLSWQIQMMKVPIFVNGLNAI